MEDKNRPFTAEEWDGMALAMQKQHLATAEEELLAELARDARQNFHAETDARTEEN